MFEHLSPLAADPILGLMTAFRADDNAHKIDLGVGVYKDEAGATPVMRAVKAAETRLLASQATKSYVGPAGAALYNEEIANLVLGTELAAKTKALRYTFQTSSIRASQVLASSSAIRPGRTTFPYSAMPACRSRNTPTTTTRATAFASTK